MSQSNSPVLGASVAVFSVESQAGAELLSGLERHVGTFASIVGDLQELDAIIKRQPLEAIICMGGNAESALPLIDDVQSCVAGRVPIILVAPSRHQNAVIQGFRRGMSDVVLMDDACVAEIGEAIERIRKKRDLSSHHASDFWEQSSRLLSPQDLLHKIDENMRQSSGTIGVLSIQIVEVGYFARKFGLAAVEELTREFAKRLLLAISESGYFCRRPDSTFVVALNAVATTAALEMKIGQIANEVSFLATVSDLDFRIECVTGACDPSIAEEALSAVERADTSLKEAIARQVSYHIGGSGIDGLPLRYSLVRRKRRNAERRGGERQSVHRRAKFFLDHLNASVECIVLDVSRSGARLRITDSLMLPDEFDLLLSYQGERQRVRLRWRRHKDIGVEFIKSSASAPV